MPPDLQICLVTYPGSRFPEAAGEAGLMAGIAEAARQRGWQVDTAVVGEDLLRPGDVSFDRRSVRTSIHAELDLERRWRRHVTGRLTLGDRVEFAVRGVVRRARLAPWWRREPNASGVRMLRRLANIELAHLRAMEVCAQSHARWSLILEDDAQSPDVAVFTEELLAFLDAATAAGEPRTMNLSESFTIAQLRIDGVLSRATLPNQPHWSTWRASRLVTNTVCAVVYERDFLARLRSSLQSIPLEPVIPIDFKVNEAYLSMNRDEQAGCCWVVSPAPLIQGSGVPDVPAHTRGRHGAAEE